MVVVFLGHFAGDGVELDDLFVGHAGEEFGGFRGVEFDTVGYSAGFEASDAFTGLGVPELHVAVVTRGYELCARGVEVDVVDGLCVAGVGAQKLALVVYIPESNLRVCRSREQKMKFL